MKMDTRRIGRIFGLFFIGTFITSIPARILFVNGVGASWSDMRFVPGAGSNTSLQLGAIFEFSLIIANIATAVVIYPLVKRQNATVALGYVSARIMESVIIAIGLLSIISVVNINDALAAGGDTTALAVQGNSLVSTYEWAFLFGPGLVVGFGNGLMLGYLMYRSGLVPRRMAMFGLIGGPLLILSFVLTLFGAYENGVGSFGAAGTSGDRLGVVARRLLRVEGFQAQPDRRAQLRGDRLAEPENHTISVCGGDGCRVGARARDGRRDVGASYQRGPRSHRLDGGDRSDRSGARVRWVGGSGRGRGDWLQR